MTRMSTSGKATAAPCFFSPESSLQEEVFFRTAHTPRTHVLHKILIPPTLRLTMLLTHEPLSCDQKIERDWWCGVEEAQSRLCWCRTCTSRRYFPCLWSLSPIRRIAEFRILVTTKSHLDELPNSVRCDYDVARGSLYHSMLFSQSSDSDGHCWTPSVVPFCGAAAGCVNESNRLRKHRRLFTDNHVDRSGEPLSQCLLNNSCCANHHTNLAIGTCRVCDVGSASMVVITYM